MARQRPCRAKKNLDKTLREVFFICRPQDVLHGLLEPNNWVNEAELTFVVEKNIVSVLSDIRHEHEIVCERIASLGAQSTALQILGNLPVVRPSVGADCRLPEDKSDIV